MILSPMLSTATTSVSTGSSSASGSSTVLSSDFDTFLKMLTAQARYQDPLEPVSSSDYAAQLAQFSMVEQQIFTNDKLNALTNALGGSSISTLAGLVGLEARALAAVRYDGSPVTISPAPAPNATRAQLVIYNDFGTEVGRRDIPVSNAPFQWDGRDQAGREMSIGTYSFAVDSFLGEELLLSEPAEVYARVTEAQLVAGDTLLKLSGGATIPAE